MGDNNDAFMRNRDAAVQARTKAQNRATVLQLKLIGQSHPTGLTNNLLKLFEARPPLEYKPPPEKRESLPYTGMAQFVSKFAEPEDPEYAPPVQEAETSAQKRARIHMLRLENGASKAAEELQKYDLSIDPNISGDPYKTLFVARLNYETTEHRIKREFEAYGPIKRVRMVADKMTNKPRGYAFIEYMHTRDMKTAYKQADGRKLDNIRLLVDVERGRTVPNWRPRRLGGGLGSTRVGGEEVNQRYSGREPQQIASGGPPRSEEPRTREDRLVEREREKSRERGRDREREREKSRERSHDKTRDRDSREERPHRDRDRTRDRDRDRDRGRDREKDKRHDRDRRDKDRDRNRDRERNHDRGHDRSREREKDHERGGTDHDNVRYSRDRGSEYDNIEPKQERDRDDERERGYDQGESEHDREWFEQSGRGYGRPENEPEHHHHGKGDPDRYDPVPEHGGKEIKLEPPEDDYQYDHADFESRRRERTRDQEREYQRSERSLSREYEH